jgi:hypothetical protein
VSNDLAEFLLERIAEDEATAQGAAYSPWRHDGGHYVMNHATIAEVDDPEDGRHIARWHPARVLAECEVKRRIVEHVQHAQERYDQERGSGYGDGADMEWLTKLEALEPVLQMLAQPYSDHPAFRDEWRLS